MTPNMLVAILGICAPLLGVVFVLVFGWLLRRLK